VIPTEIDDFEREGEQAYIPMENLSVLDAADVLLWATEKPEDRVALEGEPLFRDLEEVEAGRLVYTDGITAGAIYFTSVLSLPHVVEHLVPALAETLAGNGPSEVQSS
jgi:iron complex transport system substrate-binding protein